MDDKADIFIVELHITSDLGPAAFACIIVSSYAQLRTRKSANIGRFNQTTI